MLTSNLGLAQTAQRNLNNSPDTFVISAAKLRIANQIFIEHKNQKVIIAEKNKEISLLENEIALGSEKTITLEKLVESKVNEIVVIEKQNFIINESLKNEITIEKKTKNKFKILAIILGAVSVLALVK